MTSQDVSRLWVLDDNAHRHREWILTTQSSCHHHSICSTSKQHAEQDQTTQTKVLGTRRCVVVCALHVSLYTMLYFTISVCNYVFWYVLMMRRELWRISIANKSVEMKRTKVLLARISTQWSAPFCTTMQLVTTKSTNDSSIVDFMKFFPSNGDGNNKAAAHTKGREMAIRPRTVMRAVSSWQELNTAKGQRCQRC